MLVLSFDLLFTVFLGVVLTHFYVEIAASLAMFIVIYLRYPRMHHTVSYTQ